jgi:hypothetical protein
MTADDGSLMPEVNDETHVVERLETAVFFVFLD